MMTKEQYFFVVAICAAFLVAFLLLYPFLHYLFLALLSAYMLHPLQKILERRIKSRALCALVLIVLMLVIVILPIGFVSSQLVGEIKSTFSRVVADSSNHGAYREKIEEFIKRFSGENTDLHAYQERLLDEVKSFAVRMAPNLLGSLTEVLLGLFIMIFVMFYVLQESQKSFERLRAMIPLEPRLKDKLIEEIQNVTWAVVYGQVMTAVVQGMLGGLGFLIFKVSSPLLWGFIMIILSCVPLVGATIIWAPAGIFLIMSGATFRGIGLLVWGGVLVMNIDNLLKPRLISGRSNIHPVTVFLGVLGGLKLFGVIGLVAGPLILALLIALIRFYEEEYMGMRKAESPI
jgi:predicted PurR-regulated permease PerM